MVRRQIQLSEQQAKALRELSHRRGVSQAALVREAVAELVQGSDNERREARFRASIGRFRGGAGGTVSRDHDRYLADAFDE